MKIDFPQLRSTRKSGFTLIEMIGVIAIMAILAAVVTPNALRMLDREATRAEVSTLHTLGEQVKLYLRETDIEPTSANWNTMLGTANYVALSPADLLVNRRQMTRIYVSNPASQRAMFLSSMRNGLALPPVNTISANFGTIWDTPQGSVPGGGGWGSWNAGNIEYLVIERINLRPVYLTDLQDLPIVLTIASGTPSYRLVRANGAIVQRGTTPANFNAHPNQKLELYRNNNYTNLDSTYVFTSRGAQYNFNGTTWLPSGP